MRLMCPIRFKSPMRFGLLTVLLMSLLLVTAGGCAGDKKKDSKAQAVRQWQEARAGVLHGLAKDQYKNGNFVDCRATLNEALKLAPENVQLRILSAKLAIEQGQLEVADRELSKARQVDPKNAEIDYLSGVIYQRWQKHETAYEYYVSASDKQPAELAYIMARSEMLVAMGRHPEALALLQEKMNYFEHSAVIRDAVGQLLVQSGKYNEGSEILRQATILGPDDLTIREHLAMALYLDKDYRAASEELTRLTANEKYAKRGDLWMALGECQIQMNDSRSARRSFDAATQLNPNLASAWLSLGRAQLQANDLRRAEGAAKRALSLEPENGQAHLLIGYIRLRQGKKDDALASFRKASALDQQDTVSLCMVGYTLERMGKSEQALKCYAKALKIKPNDDMARKLMASIQVAE